MRIALPSTRVTRNATNESVHRSMNERTEVRTAHPDGSMRCECECFRVECASNFQITLDAYETVRANGRNFVVAPGHQSDEEPVLSTTPTYLVITKVGAEGLIAETLDPR
jgi:hypothetical protein